MRTKAKIQTRYDLSRDVEEVTEYGLSPARMTLGADPTTGRLDGARQPDRRHVALARAFLEGHAARTKTIRKLFDSYSVAHRAIEWYRQDGESVYISNGAVIQAALELGYRAVRTRPDSPNAFFDMRWL